jgi:type VI protein secretion system component VasF
MECVAACPAQGALEMVVAKRRRVPVWAMAAGMAVVLFGVVAYAHWAGYWHTNVPSQTYFELIPRANEFSHP